MFSQSLIENVEVFKTEGQTSSIHFLCSYAAMHALCIYPILSKCGALYRLSQFRSFHNLRLSKRKLTPHFLFVNRLIWSGEYKSNFYEIKGSIGPNGSVCDVV